jgi:hypothetical protein
MRAIYPHTPAETVGPLDNHDCARHMDCFEQTTQRELGDLDAVNEFLEGRIFLGPVVDHVIRCGAVSKVKHCGTVELGRLSLNFQLESYQDGSEFAPVRRVPEHVINLNSHPHIRNRVWCVHIAGATVAGPTSIAPVGCEGGGSFVPDGTPQAIAEDPPPPIQIAPCII